MTAPVLVSALRARSPLPSLPLVVSAADAPMSNATRGACESKGGVEGATASGANETDGGGSAVSVGDGGSDGDGGGGGGGDGGGDGGGGDGLPYAAAQLVVPDPPLSVNETSCAWFA